MIQVCNLSFANSSITDTLGNYSLVSSGNITINGVDFPTNTDPILYVTDSSYSCIEFGQTATYSNGAIIQVGIPDYGSENWAVEFRARVTSAMPDYYENYEIFYGCKAPYDNNGTTRMAGHWSISISNSLDALEFAYVDHYDTLTIKDNLDFTAWHLYKVTKTAEEILTLHIDGVLVVTIDLEQQIGYKTRATLGSFALLGDVDGFPTENRIKTNQSVRLADVKVYADPMGHAEKAVSLDNLSRVFRNYNTWLGSQLSGKANSSHTHTKSEITDFPTLATVATSGSYNDLSNKPTVPTKVSDLQNDSNFISNEALQSHAENASHLSASDREKIDNLITNTFAQETFASIASLNSHVNNGSVHLSQSQINTWNSKANASHTHSISDVTDLQSELDDIRAEITAVRETGGIRAMENSEIGELSWN